MHESRRFLAPAVPHRERERGKHREERPEIEAKNPPDHSEAINMSLFDEFDEARLHPALADMECDHGRMAHDLTPDCGCF